MLVRLRRAGANPSPGPRQIHGIRLRNAFGVVHLGGSKGFARRGAPRAKERARALLPVVLLLTASVANCGGRSSSVESDGDGASASGDAGSTTGGTGIPSGGVSVGGSAGAVSMGGFTTGGTPTGGMAGGPLDPDVRCNLPVAFGACRTRSDEYWFDASTGLCMPFDYYGCSGNENRFASAEECYAVCGGRGLNDFAKCETSADCRPKRLAEPCCSLDVREFVGIHRNFDFVCTETRICTHCAADCDYVPPDGYIGASCIAGNCIAFDLREVAPPLCMTDDGCYLRYGVECCADCRPEQSPSKLVALATNFDLAALACGDEPCADSCDYTGYRARCSANNQCEVVTVP